MRLTYPLRILIHLDRYKNGEDNGYSARKEITQRGIASGVDLPLEIVRVNLSRLVAREELEWAWRRVESERNRRKVYRLTPRGLNRLQMLPVTVRV